MVFAAADEEDQRKKERNEDILCIEYARPIAYRYEIPCS